MSHEAFERSVELPVSAEQAFGWHARPGAVQRLTPPWEQVRIERSPAEFADGQQTVLQVRVGPVWRRWVAEFRDVQPGRGFRDVQVEGPFREWDHEHRFEAIDEGRCHLVDRIEYGPPGGWLGAWLGRDAIVRRLGRMFASRHRTLLNDLQQQAAYRDREPLTVAITGASGLVGSALTSLLTTAGHRVRPMVRRKTDDPDAIEWNTQDGVVDPQQLADVDAIVHLAGENVMGRWTQRKKQAIRDSRIAGTAAIAKSLERAEPRPRTLVSASGMNFYGDRGDEVLTEDADSGEGFLADVVREWEGAAQQAEGLGVRVAMMRLGAVLTPRGAALGQMLTPFRLGVGGVLGSGEQYMSWASIDDVVGAFYHALMNEEVRGPVNVGSPEPVTNRTLTQTLGRVLHRPTVLPMPAAAIRAAFGDMADEMLLGSVRMQPKKLIDTGYSFRDPDLETALRWLLGRGIG